MKINDQEKAALFAAALPYVRKYINQITVLRYDAEAVEAASVRNALLSDIALLNQIGVKTVLVTDGTDPELCESIVAVLCEKGAGAVGLSGVDGKMLTKQGEEIVVNADIVKAMLSTDVIPVISAYTVQDGKKTVLSQDMTAAALAGTLNALAFINLAACRGILEKQDDENSLLRNLSVSVVPRIVKSGAVHEKLLDRLLAGVEAIRRGVKNVFIIDGRQPHAILVEMLSDEGIGTKLY